MAGLTGVAQIEEEALAAGAIETVVQVVAPAAQKIKILAWGVFFDGTSSTAAPVELELQRQTSAGTSSALTPVRWDDDQPALQTTARQDFTAEPGKSDVLESKEVHPQTGYEVIYPPGGEPWCGVGDRIGIEVTAPAAVNCRAYIRFEE